MSETSVAGNLSRYFTGIMESMNDAIAVVDSDLNVVFANESFYEIADWTDGEGAGPVASGAAHFIRSDTDLIRIIQSLFRGKEGPSESELRLENRSGIRRSFSVHLHRLFSEGAMNPLVLLSLRDTSALPLLIERLQQEMEACSLAMDELQDSDNRFRILIETMNDGLAVRDKHGVLTYVNTKICEMLGLPRDEIIGRAAFDFLDRENQQTLIEQIAKREEGLTDSYELNFTNRNGRKIHALMSPKPIYDSSGQVRGAFAIVTDITERKHMETALRESERKLRVLSGHLMTAQETEREHIARELHDELGQDLAVLKYQMRFIEKRLRKDQKPLKEACLDMLQHIDQLVENVRRISRNLGLHNLQHLGLTASLRKVAEDFGKRCMIPIELDTINIDNLMSQEAATNLYRIFQETLTNIGKHARATQVTIKVTENHGILCFSVVDNGVGFNVPETKTEFSKTSGMGLTTMEERAKMVGGSLEIKSGKGEGTFVSLSIPLNGGQVSAQPPNNSGRRSPIDPTGHQEDNRGQAGA